MADIDSKLLATTQDLGRQFDEAAKRLAGPPVDLRIFFTFAHGFITKKIGKHIDLFRAPNPLMRLNESFATTYLANLRGPPNANWEKAFKVCRGEMDAMRSGLAGTLALGATAYEVCGACMANIHINVDLKNALDHVRDVDAQDYGNVLIFVQLGNFYAEKQIRGAMGAALMIMTATPFQQWLKLDVKQWRNSVYEKSYGLKPGSVPDPEPAFTRAIGERENLPIGR
jgi:hypothetical protein